MCISFIYYKNVNESFWMNFYNVYNIYVYELYMCVENFNIKVVTLNDIIEVV